MATLGGKRVGSGRPRGAKTLIKAIDYFDKKELKAFWNDLKERAKTDNKIALYFAEQFTGKAAQAVDIGNQDGNPFVLKLVNYNG